MHLRPWYQELFDNYAESYDRESFTQGTPGEVDFIEKEIGHDRKIRVIDIGCGTGRHAIELAGRGYRVTGIDLSESQLKKAKEKAARAGVGVEFVRMDAVRLNFHCEFDLALILCEGAFPLMETDEMNFAVLQNASDALKPKGKLILTTLNGLYPLTNSVKDFLDAHPGGVSTKAGTFDLMTFRNFSTVEVKDDDGRMKKLECSERYYVPSEITWLMKTAGFRRVDIFGCPLGAFSRGNPLTAGDFEMLVVAEKE
jgi:2-polyprenyl-3-methyl-5-hydroxy-6-metoxy-1,4-benzoquinol methylase